MRHHRLPPLIALLWFGALAPGLAMAAGDADADGPLVPPASDPANPLSAGYVDPVDQWLAEVKAQRKAREERRRATREAINARRRLTDPWGAAHQESHEKESQRRRDAMMEQIDREREAFRDQGPWQLPSPMDQGPPPPPASGAASEAGDGEPPSAVPTYPPSGWNNRWYYRGY